MNLVYEVSIGQFCYCIGMRVNWLNDSKSVRNVVVYCFLLHRNTLFTTVTSKQEVSWKVCFSKVKKLKK